MLMMPPAFTTKSGAHRMSRSARRSAIDSSESWLFAAPAITGACSRGTVSGLSTPPSAHGARTSTSAVSALSGAIHRAPSLSASVRLRWSMSETTSVAPRRASRRAGRRATLPRPATPPDAPRRAPLQRCRAERPLAAREHGRLDAERGVGRRVAGAAARLREPAHVLRRAHDHRHVARRRADVLGRDVRAADRLDGLAEVEQEVAARAALRRPVAEHDHALAAPERQARARRLVGHRAREPEHVRDTGGAVVVAPHPAPAEARPADRRVHGDGAVQPRPRAAADEQLLVLEGDGLAVHGGARRYRSARPAQRASAATIRGKTSRGASRPKNTSMCV